MALTKKRLLEIAEKIRYTKYNEYSSATKVTIREGNAGPHILLSFKIMIDTEKIDSRIRALHYMTTDIENIVRDMYPNDSVKCDDLSVAIYSNNVEIAGFIWIK